MKFSLRQKIILLTIIISLFSAFIQNNAFIEEDKAKYKKFQRGEKLTYLAHYGFIDAGEAVVSIDKKLHKINNKVCYNITVKGKTIGVFGWTTKVKDIWQSYIDTAELLPQQFYREIRENSYKLIETSIFDHIDKKVKVAQIKNGKTENSVYDIPPFVQDLISSYYYLRTLNFNNFKEGDTIKMNAFFEDEVYNFNILFLGKERLTTKFGRINTFVMTPIMPHNSLFDGENSIKFWVSNDIHRIPLKVKAEMFVGAVEIDLTRYSGFKSKFNTSKK